MRFLVVLFMVMFFVSCGDEKSENDNEVMDQDTVVYNEMTDDAEVADMNDAEMTDEVDEEIPDVDTAVELIITDRVLIKTSMGEITIGLYGEETPNTAENFKQYVTDNFFDDLIFHRVIPGFVAQAGGYDKDLVAKETRNPIKFEASPRVKHLKYVLSMGRSSVNSATSQFFIMLEDDPHLDFESEDDFFDETKYPCTAFGIVTDGFDVVDAIGEVETETSGIFENVPVEPIIIESAILIN